MKAEFRKFLTLFLCFALVFSVGFYSGCEKENSKKTIYIVAKGSTSAFWQSVMKGAEVSAVEHNVDVVFKAPENEEDHMGQAKLIDEAINAKAHVIMLSAIDYEKSAQYVDKAVNSGIPVIAFDSETKSEKPLVRINIDNVVAGSESFKFLRSQVSGKLNVGIINFKQDTANGQRRERGFKEELAKDKSSSLISQKYVNSDIDSAYTETKKMIEEFPQINAITTFNEWTTLGVGKAIKEMGKGDEITILGFDNNPVSASHLEEGVIDGLIVQNPYAMGYVGIEKAVEIINGQLTKKQKVTIKTVTATRENMFDKDVAQLLFPFYVDNLK